MFRVYLLFFALLAPSAAGVPDGSMVAALSVAAEARDVAVASADNLSDVALSSTAHYGRPPCLSDEEDVRVRRVDGVFRVVCSPSCDAYGMCPPDVPRAVMAVSTVVLE